MSAKQVLTSSNERSQIKIALHGLFSFSESSGKIEAWKENDENRN